MTSVTVYDLLFREEPGTAHPYRASFELLTESPHNWHDDLDTVEDVVQELCNFIKITMHQSGVLAQYEFVASVNKDTSLYCQLAFDNESDYAFFKLSASALMERLASCQ